MILADVNKDLKLDETDKEIFLSQYMSDIPFIYTLDEGNHTMTLTGAKDNTITYMKIPGEYYVNQTAYAVTAIAENAFSDCLNLEEVYIPSSVTQIAGDTYKKSPFYGISYKVLKIYCEASSATSGYSKYWSYGHRVIYNYTMKNIEDYFEYTADEENKTITITGVKQKSYTEANGIITVHDRYLVNGEEYRVTAIDDYAFYYVGMGGDMKSVELPAGITVIGEWAFADNDYVEDIDLVRCRYLKEIKASAFAYCPKLCEIWIPESVEYIYADTLEDSMIYESNEDIVIYVEAETAGENWGAYWNYIQEKNEAETVYMGSAA